VVGFLDPFVNDPNSYTILLPNSNSNGNPFANSSLLSGTYSFASLNFSKASCVVTLSVYSSLVAYRPSYVYCCCCCKCCSKFYKCCGLVMVSIQSSYIFPSKCKRSSPFRNLVSCSSLTSCLYSLNYLFCKDVIYGTSCLCSFSCVSCGVVICGISIVCLAICTIVDIANGFILSLIIFCALKSVLSYSLFTLELEAPPFSTLFFLLKTLLEEFVATFFLFSSVVFISSLVLLTLVGGFCGFSFQIQNSQVYKQMGTNLTKFQCLKLM